MTSPQRSPCPPEHELLQFTSAELSSRRMARIRGHIAVCGTCASRITELNSTLDAFRDHQPTVEHPVPKLDDFRQALLAEDCAWNQRRTTHRRWSSVAAVAATLLIAAIWYTQTEVTLDAEGVIARTIEHERNSTAPLNASIRRVATGEGSAGDEQQTPALRATVNSEQHGDPAAARELSDRLAPYGFTLEAPLSVRHFQRWRLNVGSRTDRVRRVADSLLQISTVAPTDAAIRQADILVTADSYEAVAQRWHFADGFAVELTRSAAPSVPLAPTKAVEAVRPTLKTVPSSNLDLIELDARIAFQRQGAPIGRRVSIRREHGRIQLVGAVNDEQRLANLTAYASGQKALKVALSLENPPADWDAMLLTPAWRAWLDQSFGELKVRATYSRSLWQALEDLLNASAALQNLAERYPRSVAEAMSAESRRTFDGLVERQYRDSQVAYERLERQLAPLVGTVSRSGLSPDLPTTWRDRAPGIGSAVRSLSAALSDLHSPSLDDPRRDFVGRARLRLRPALESAAEALASNVQPF